MPEYIYEATNEQGAIQKGEFSAVSKGLVIEYLRKKNLIPVIVREKRAISSRGISLWGGGITVPDKITMVRNLSATSRAGISMLEAVDILIADASRPSVREVLVTAKSNLENGQPLSITFEGYKKYFPPVFIGMIKAGEASGQLTRVLEDLAYHMTKEYNLFRKVRSAFIYPAILLTGSAAVIFLLLAFILPRLARTFQSSSVELPAITKFLMSIGAVLNQSYLLDIFVFGFLVWFMLYARKKPWGKSIINAFVFKVPAVKELAKRIALVRFSRTFGNLVASGMTILPSLELSARASGSIYYERAILIAMGEVQNGTPLSVALGKHPALFPGIFVSMVGVGERTGSMEKIFKDFAEFYEEEMDTTLKNLTAFLEPILLLIMGVIILTIALSVLLPVYQLVGSFV